MPDKIVTILACFPELLREGVLRALEGSHFDVVAAGPSVGSLPQDGGEKRPALAILVTQGKNIASECRAVIQLFPGCRIAMLAENLDCLNSDILLETGGGAFLYQTISRDNLLRSLDLVIDGMSVMPFPLVCKTPSEPEAGQDETSSDRGDNGQGDSSSAVATCLSERELRVLEGLAKGASNKVIARRLEITESTVKVHVKSIFRKTQMHNRVQLALWAATKVTRPKLGELPEGNGSLSTVLIRNPTASSSDFAVPT